MAAVVKIARARYRRTVDNARRARLLIADLEVEIAARGEDASHALGCERADLAAQAISRQYDIAHLVADERRRMVHAEAEAEALAAVIAGLDEWSGSPASGVASKDWAATPH